MKIIAFGHRKGVGKDTVSNILANKLRYKYSNVQVVGFADKIKDIAYELFGWAGLQAGWYYESNSKEGILPKLGKTPREIWIDVGNTLRQVRDEVWSEYVLKNPPSCDVLIIKDLRFHAEAEAILAKGGWLYRIDADWCPKVSDGADNVLANYLGWTGAINSVKDGMLGLEKDVDSIITRHFNDA